MELLKVENLTKVYKQGDNEVRALDGVSFKVNKGEFVAIIGASGSGKSTLLHCLGGVDNPTSGSIKVEDVEISTMKEQPLTIFRRRQIGLVYQFYNLIPTLDVKDNIQLPILLDNAKVDQEYYRYLLETLALADRVSHLPSELSGGQQQRVSIGRALMNRPALLLLDEPTGNLDQKTSQEIIEVIKKGHKELNQTILLVTHDETIAGQADRIIRIEDGKITLDEVLI
jgi:putative ABC transport system ATP-binding protein